LVGYPAPKLSVRYDRFNRDDKARVSTRLMCG